MIALRSLFFLAWAALFSAFWFTLFLPGLVLPRAVVVFGGRLWAKHMLWCLKVFCGLRYEVHGNIDAARAPVIVASKHYSMWETIAVVALLPNPAIILKRELHRIPFYGWYSIKMRMIAIDRKAGPSALRRMTQQAKRAIADGRPIVIFPEGTRKQLGAPRDYKPGVAGLYAQLGVACVPVAHNSGQHWRGWLKLPGRVVIEFLEPIPAGLARDDFMALLQTRTEAAVKRLLAAGV